MKRYFFKLEFVQIINCFVNLLLFLIHMDFLLHLLVDL